MLTVIMYQLVYLLFTHARITAQSPLDPEDLSRCKVITPLHNEVANFAVQKLGTGYSLREIVGVREQVGV